MILVNLESCTEAKQSNACLWAAGFCAWLFANILNRPNGLPYR